MKIILRRKKIWLISCFLILMSIAGCSSMSTFDQQAYSQTVSLKIDALKVMDLATNDYALHQEKAELIKTQLLKCHEYAKHRPKNTITTEMWQVLLDENGHLLGGFLVRWEKDKVLGKTFIVESKKLIGNAFDKIAELESKKIKTKNP